MSMNDREQALFGYFATIALDPRVRASKSLDILYRAILACLKEDLPAVGARVLGGLARPVASRFLDKIFAEFEDLVGNLGKGGR